MYFYPHVLITGFTPFLHYTKNITSEIANKLDEAKIAPTHIFDVIFDSEMFLQTYQKHHPSFIIGMGQMERARKIRIERKAMNHTSLGTPINPEGTSHIHLKLKLPKTAESTITYDAGDYVCNFSMYVTAEYCEQNNAKSAFLHIPNHLQADSAVKYIKHTLESIDL